MNMMSRILIAVVSRDLKTPEKGAETKNKMLPCDLKKNLLQFFTVIATQDSNTTKK